MKTLFQIIVNTKNPFFTPTKYTCDGHAET